MALVGNGNSLHGQSLTGSCIFILCFVFRPKYFQVQILRARDLYY